MIRIRWGFHGYDSIPVPMHNFGDAAMRLLLRSASNVLQSAGLMSLAQQATLSRCSNASSIYCFPIRIPSSYWPKILGSTVRSVLSSAADLVASRTLLLAGPCLG